MSLPVAPALSEASALVAVLQRASFTKAAVELGLSPARVSELVRNLEERLGVRLVERTTRSVAPTAAGERLVERLGPLLDDYQSAFNSLDDFRAAAAGTLRLTVPPPAADFVLAPVLPRFLTRYSAIRLDISIERAFVDIVSRRFDAGIRPGERIARDMVAIPISDAMPFVVVASPDYVSRRGAPKTPPDLTSHVCISVRHASGALAPWRFGKGRRMVEVQVDGPLVVTEPAIAVAAAIGGVGLVQLPLPYLAPDIQAGRLVTVLAGCVQPRIDGFFLYYPSRRQIRPALKAFSDFMRNEYRRDRTI